MTRTKRSLAVVVATVLLATGGIIGMPSPALAQTISLAPTAGAPGTAVTATGTCPGIPMVIIPNRARVTMPGGVNVIDDTLGPAGEFSVGFGIPALSPGTYTVTVACSLVVANLEIPAGNAAADLTVTAVAVVPTQEPAPLTGFEGLDDFGPAVAVSGVPRFTG